MKRGGRKRKYRERETKLKSPNQTVALFISTTFEANRGTAATADHERSQQISQKKITEMYFINYFPECNCYRK